MIIFATGAAKPDSWEPGLKAAAFINHDHDKSETRLLAFDTLYHYKPSSTPLLIHASCDLHASLMAFDLLLVSSASFTN